MTNYVEIPTFIQQSSYSNYNEELNQTLRQLLGSDFWIMPSITTAQATALEPEMAIGAFFFNSNIGKMQLKTAAGTIETVTSV